MTEQYHLPMAAMHICQVTLDIYGSPIQSQWGMAAMHTCQVTLDISGSLIESQWGMVAMHTCQVTLGISGSVPVKLPWIFQGASLKVSGKWWPCIPVKLLWIFPGALLTFNGAPGNIQGNLTGMPCLIKPQSRDTDAELRCVNITQNPLLSTWEPAAVTNSKQISVNTVADSSQGTHWGCLFMLNTQGNVFPLWYGQFLSK